MSNILEWYEKQSDRLRLIFVIISELLDGMYAELPEKKPKKARCKRHRNTIIK